MSNSVSTEKIDNLVATLDRPQLLAMLGVEDKLMQVGDHEVIRAISASAVDPVVIYKMDAPFLGKIQADGCCAGAIVRRFKNATVGIPCYSDAIESGNKFCDVCNEIWSGQDDRGFYVLNWESMPNAAEFYAPAKSGTLWKLPFMMTMEEFFSDEIQIVKDMFEGSDLELHRDWPNTGFQEVATDILIKSGVLHRDADRSRNPYRRDAWEHDHIAEYLREMLACWLRVRTMIEPDEMSREVQALHRTAKAVGMAATWRVQREHRRVPILRGPVVPADIMLAAFRSACSGFKVLVHNIATDKVADALEVPDFDWGERVESFRQWASNIKMLKRPARKPAPRYIAQQPTTPAKAKSNAGSKQVPEEAASSPSSPSQVHTWYAAKNTSRPGAYVHREVAESYNLDNRGSIKQFSSLAAARKWLKMPAPRMFYEKECYAASQPAAFFAVKGGLCAGVYTSMTKAVQAKQDGGGTFAVFSNEAEARAFAQQKQVFVVWAGRTVGVMSQQQCIAATQRLEGAKMRGPMDADQADELWESLQVSARLLPEQSKSPVKASKTKKKPKKKFYYAVAVGRVPGVYEDWKECERQVKSVRPNLYAKFETKTLAQEFVDSHSKKARKKAPSPTPSMTSTTSRESDAETAASAPDSHNSFSDVSDESQTQGTKELSIETPTTEELEKAEEEGKVRVYACHTDVGSARIAVSFEKAIEGVRNPEVQVVNSESTLLDNLAVAEVRLRTDVSGKRKSLSDRLAEARARAGAKSHARTSAVASSPKASATAGAYGGGMLVNRSAVGRAKETQMIQYYFIDCPTPIKVEHGSSVPFPSELDDDMELPNTKAIFNTAGQVKDLTITDFFKAKEKAISSWPLLGFQEFMRVCRKAQRMCQASKKANGVANAAALGELMDIALRVHRTYERMGTLGVPDSIRFRARMFLHLQHACMTRVVHASAIAMTVFEDATDPFCARLPEYSKPKKPVRPASAPLACKDVREERAPMSGCYLCPATDHYCSDRTHHPLVNGKHKPISEETKEAILKRIESSSLSSGQKANEKKAVRRYWSQHAL